MYELTFRSPRLLSELFTIPVDQTTWTGGHHWTPQGWTSTRDRATYKSWKRALIPLAEQIRERLDDAYGIYMLALDLPEPTLYIGLAAEGGGAPEGVLSRIRKHRVKITGSHVGPHDQGTGGVHHPQRWRAFAADRSRHLAQIGVSDACDDVRLAVGTLTLEGQPTRAAKDVLAPIEACLMCPGSAFMQRITALLWPDHTGAIRLLNDPENVHAHPSACIRLWDGAELQCHGNAGGTADTDAGCDPESGEGECEGNPASGSTAAPDCACTCDRETLQQATTGARRPLHVRHVCLERAQVNVREPSDAADSAQVIFAVRSPSLQECEAIAGAVTDVYNHWVQPPRTPAPIAPRAGNAIRVHGNWAASSPHHKLAPEGVYVYAYADVWSSPSGFSADKVFYIGRGRQKRLHSHLHQAANFGGFAVAANPLEFSKLERIRELTTAFPQSNPRDLVRVVAHFDGDFRLQQAAAVEHFLINHWKGVYELANATRGDEHVDRGDSYWISQPSGVGGGAWHRMLEEFTCGADIGQTLRKRLCESECNVAFTGWLGFSLQVVNPNSGITARLIPPAGVPFTSNGTDVFVEHLVTLQPPGGVETPCLRLHLKMSDSDAGAWINLRPLTTNVQAFGPAIANAFFTGDVAAASSAIRNKNGLSVTRDSFYKPLAPGGNGRRDTRFDIRDSARGMTYRIDGIGWHPGNCVQGTLDDVLKKLLEALSKRGCDPGAARSLDG